MKYALKIAGSLTAALLFAACHKDDDTPALIADAQPYYYADSGLFVSVPTAFTPNGDARNDHFGPITNAFVLSGYSFTVSNAAGKALFQVSTPSTTWWGVDPDGNYYPPGVYRATVKFNNSAGQQIVKEVNFALLAVDSVRGCVKTNGQSYTFPDQINANTGKLDRPTLELPACN